MANEHGEWILYGVDAHDPYRLKTPQELLEYIQTVGFLPLFKNEIPGFSVEERTLSRDWWTGDARRDPWEWRTILAASGKVAYGKFFDKKAGFIALDRLPDFANYRRDGYDFDSLWDEGKASRRQKKIMDCFASGEELFSFHVRQTAGFGKDGEKNFDGTVTDLQMHLYLVIRDFRCRLNRQGKPYGWPIAVYATPESIWGYDRLSAAYADAPQTSFERLCAQMRAQYPIATERQIRRLLK